MEIGLARYIVITIISALMVFALTAWASKRPPDKQGWSNLKASRICAIAIAGGTLFTLFVGLRKIFTGPIYILFGDGVKAHVDPYTNNTFVLIERISERLKPDDKGPDEDGTADLRQGE